MGWGGGGGGGGGEQRFRGRAWEWVRRGGGSKGLEGEPGNGLGGGGAKV